jgi:uncharacterized protein YjlB
VIPLEKHLLAGDGLIPNNEKLPLLVYRSAVAFAPARPPEEQLRTLFQAHGWRGAWVNGIYPFQHYHATSHEVLGVAEGEAVVQFGGPRGRILRLQKGDVVVLPAGVGHCRKDSQAGLLVVGAYPEGQENWDLKRENEIDHRQALGEIPRVALPASDPVYGASGPLVALWR